MSRRQKPRRGFTLVEMMVSLTIMMFVIISLITLIITTQNAHLTEGRKLDMNQGARVVEQMLYDGFRSSGSVLSLANTPALLGSPNVPFNGVYPLNNNNYPDGVILSSGDPDAVTRLTADFAPGATTINVITVDRPPDGVSAAAVAWQENDLGLVMRSNGYYVFRVTATPALGDTQLTIRSNPAYYSGLLNTANYNDACDEQLGIYGNSGNYISESPVVRLEFFNIFLTRSEADGSLTLTLSTDCDGVWRYFLQCPSLPAAPYPSCPISPICRSSTSPTTYRR